MSTKTVYPLEYDSQRVYVIGDVHGCAQELGTILSHVMEVASGSDTIIFIGDYIDRGPSSSSVIDIALELKANHERTVFLKGNHEAMLLDYLDKPRSIESRFLQFGGVETFQSYGASTEQVYEDPKSIFPESHLSFFSNLSLGVIWHDFVMVHAGIRFTLPLEEQKEEDLLWIREEFVPIKHPLPYTIVFGHTPQKKILLDMPYKIGIDTGCVYGNKLSCIELSERKIYQVAFGTTKLLKSKW